VEERCASGRRITASAWIACAFGAGCLLGAPTAAPAAGPRVVGAGSLEAAVDASPWRITLTDRAHRTVLAMRTGGTAAAPDGALGFQAAGRWHHATRATALRVRGGTVVATLATDDPAGRSLQVRVARDAGGVITIRMAVTGADLAAVTATGAAFAARPGERYLGFGERSNAVDQRGGTVDSQVSDGPYVAADRPIVGAVVPPAGWVPRDDASYFPIPWLLSTSGYGVLVDDDERVTHHLDGGGTWSVEVAAAHLDLRVFAGPRPADALRRMSARVGRQPPAAAPFTFGPWFQPPTDAVRDAAALRAADAPASLAMTYGHYLPCGLSDAERVAQRETTAALHAAGLASTTYVNPMICTTQPAYDSAVAAGALGKTATGAPYEYRYFTSRFFGVGQFDFSAPAGVAFYGTLLDQAYQDGHDGWMEDFGEYTPADLRSADGTPGTAMHNRYPVLYHAAAWSFARRRARPLVRFSRSGWTGAARSSQVVWGGDPTVDWGYDGLASSVRNGLTMGLSGVSLWGSDIGGYFAISAPQTTPELLRRWIEFGAASGVMRTQADGTAIGAKAPRAQILDPDVLPVWRRYAKLRTQLYPYLAAAQREYDRSGLPLMRQLALAYPADAAATARDDEYLLGPDLLVAPVLEPGATTRRLYLPAGRWIDVWRSVAYRPGDGSFDVTGTRTLAGGHAVTLPAPADELPMLARAGAVIPLLAPDVQTLSPYGGKDVVHLADRSDRLRLLAFPRGRTSAALGDGGDRALSHEAPGRWTLTIDGSRTRQYRVQAGLGALRHRLVPCRVTVDGRPLPRSAWSYGRASRVLQVTATLRRGTITVAGCA
jgi:alpha-glucosidase (family GH31 glycosyl hydrolase)